MLFRSFVELGAGRGRLALASGRQGRLGARVDSRRREDALGVERWGHDGAFASELLRIAVEKELWELTE